MRCTSRAAEIENRSLENRSPFSGEPFSVLRRTVLRSPENGSPFRQPEKCNAYIYKNVTGLVNHTISWSYWFEQNEPKC